MNSVKLIDISPSLSSDSAVFPGDVPFSRTVAMDTKDGSHVSLSSVNMSLHLGAHCDAPNHYGPSSVGIDERDLNYYYGVCQVLSLPTTDGVLRVASDYKFLAKRVLFKTDSYLNPNQWQDDFSALSPELIDMLAAQKVITVAIDTPSIDAARSKDLLAHKRVLHHDMAIIEGLVLKNVKDGLYTLCAFPLKISGGDAAPTRAVLIDNGSEHA